MYPSDFPAGDGPPARLSTFHKLWPIVAFLLLVGGIGAILYPRFESGYPPAMSASRLSAMKQLAVVAAIYAGDYDDGYPVAELGGRRTALGWAGRLVPYANRSSAFAKSPQDRARGARPEALVYGMNAETARIANARAVADPSRTVLVFETEGSLALPDDLDATGGRERLSTVGDGTPRGLADSLSPSATPVAKYAIGLLAETWDVGFATSMYRTVAFADTSARIFGGRRQTRFSREWTFEMHGTEKSRQ